LRRMLMGGLLVVAIALGGCSTTDSLTAVSSKNVNISNIRLDQTRFRGRGQGEDCKAIFVIFPTGTPNLKDALDRALESKQGDVLLNARLRHHWFYIPYIYGEDCFSAEGDVYANN
jgi:hypothetical protein